jgi:putative N6-adenine-specific DNA methylase
MYPLFLACLPGFEPVVQAEASKLGLATPRAVPGGVETTGDRASIWRANLHLRCASAVLVRIASFHAAHLAQLDKRARKVAWGDWLRADMPVRVDVTCTRSRIYHQKAAAQRIETALREEAGIATDPDATLRLMARIEDDLVTISLDTSGDGLHKRGQKQAVGKAPLRETMAAAFLFQAGYDGSQPVIDPMCGSGTFVLEAAEIAHALPAGRARTFAFERFAGHDAARFAALKGQSGPLPGQRFAGFDRDQGAIANARANAVRAGLADCTSFTCQPISALMRPDGQPGLVMVNPPYGGRIGNPRMLFALYATLGQVLRDRFRGWRLGMVTSDAKLAHATGLKLQSGPPIPHGGIKVKLFQADL